MQVPKERPPLISEQPASALGHSTLAGQFPVGHTARDVVVVPSQLSHCLDVFAYIMGRTEKGGGGVKQRARAGRDNGRMDGFTLVCTTDGLRGECPELSLT